LGSEGLVKAVAAPWELGGGLFRPTPRWNAHLGSATELEPAEDEPPPGRSPGPPGM